MEGYQLEKLPPVVRRFLRYVRIDTTSDASSPTTPSTERQFDLARLLLDELRALGLDDAELDEFGYVYATIPESRNTDVSDASVVGLLAHLDTSSDAPGAGVEPIVHFGYDGTAIRLRGDPSVVLDPVRQPRLRDHIGHDLITSDGTTLLGSDDKAGVALLMQLAEDLLNDRTLKRPRVRLCFTVDEEIGRGVDKLDLDRLGADVAYTIDGSGTDTISTETFNAAEAVVSVKGVMVHPGYAKGVMVNAARILVSMLARLPVGEAPETTEEREGYIHIHSLHPGTAAEARATLILRDFEETGLEARKALLKSLAEKFREQHPGAVITVDVRDQYRNMRSYIEEKDERVITFAHRAAESIGITLTEELIRGGTDGARLSELGLPTPNVFNGGHDYHSRFEWNTVQNLERSLRYVKALLVQWAEHGGSR